MFPEPVIKKLSEDADSFEHLLLTAYKQTDSVLDKNTIEMSFSYRFKTKCPEWYDF